MIEKAIQENTAALLEVAASNRELAAAMQSVPVMSETLTTNEDKPSKSPKTEKSQEKISEDETPAETAAEKKKRIAKEKREAKAAEAKAAEADKSDEDEATEEDCRAIATYIIKEKKDKPALAGVLKANKISMISEFKDGWSNLLEQLEEAAGKTLAEVSS